MGAQTLKNLFFGTAFPSPSTAFATLALNASGTWLAYSFTPDVDRTVDNVRAFISAITGSLTAAQLTVEIYSDSGGVPNASVHGPINCAAVPSANAWNNWTGLSYAVTAGTQYWLVFKNANGTPASNFPTFRFGGQNGYSFGQITGSSGIHGWLKRQTTDSGVGWTTSAAVASVGWRVGYADGTYDGLPYSNAGSIAAADRAFDTNESGVKIVLPTGPTYKIRSVSMFLGKVGTPSGALRFRLYLGSDTSPTATSNSIPVANVSTSQTWYRAVFPSSVSVPSGSTVRLVFGCAATGDTNSNSFTTSFVVPDADANSTALNFMSGIFTRLSGGSWTDTSTATVAALLHLDTDGEFSVGSSASSYVF